MRFCDRYATYNDDVAVELELTASTAVDDDADESFDLKNYDITYDKELAGSSSDDDAAKKSAAAAADTASQGSSMVTDHLAKAQKKTMDMSAPTAIPRPPLPLTPPLLRSSFMQQLRARAAAESDDDSAAAPVSVPAPAPALAPAPAPAPAAPDAAAHQPATLPPPPQDFLPQQELAGAASRANAAATADDDKSKKKKVRHAPFCCAGGVCVCVCVCLFVSTQPLCVLVHVPAPPGCWRVWHRLTLRSRRANPGKRGTSSRCCRATTTIESCRPLPCDCLFTDNALSPSLPCSCSCSCYCSCSCSCSCLPFCICYCFRPLQFCKRLPPSGADR
jgi:hypothetical protein